MSSNTFKRLSRILQYMPYALAIILFIAMLLLFFTPSPRSVSSIQQSQSLPETDAATVVPSMSVQSSSNNLRQVSVDSSKASNLPNTEGENTDSEFLQDIVHDSQVSSIDNAALNIDVQNEDQIAVSDNTDQALSTDTSVSETPKVTKVTTSRQSAAAEIPEELPVFGDKEISGQVQDTKGQSVSAVSIQLHLQSPGPDAPGSSFPRRTQSGLEGEFIFQNLPDVDYRLTIPEQDIYGQVSYITRADTSDLVLVLPDKNSVTIQGHVNDDNDQPISGVSVSIDGKNETKTDTDGSYQVRDTFTINSNHRLGFLHNGFREVNEIVRISSNSITIDKQLQPKSDVNLTGQVVNDYGIALSKASIWLFSGSAEIERRTRSDDDGYFTIDDLKSGSDYQFAVSHTGHEKYKLNKLTITESSQPIRIELKALSTGTVTGMIVNAVGYPVSNYAITIASGSVGAKVVTSDNAGQFKAVPVYEGALQISSMSVPRSTISGIKLSAGQDLFLTLIVDHGDYEIFGRIIDDGGNAIHNAQIKLSWTHSSDGLSSSSNRILKSDAQGDYRIQNIGPGLHTLMVAAAGFKNAHLDIISEQQIGPLSITLNP